MISRTFRHYIAKVVNFFIILFLKMFGIKIGKGVFISPFSKIDLRRGKIIIGNNVTITSGCYILSHSAVEKKINPGLKEKDSVIIGDNVFIGVNSVILPGVIIGNNSIIGASSVVTKNVESNCIYFGNPAKKIRKLY